MKKDKKVDPSVNLEGDLDDKPKSSDTGFHAKADSLLGAKRARSIGNRNTKPSR